MGFICRLNCRVLLWSIVLVSLISHSNTAMGWNPYGPPPAVSVGSVPPWQSSVPGNIGPQAATPPPQVFKSPEDFLVKLAYGRTYGTSTELDYATLEVSKPLTRYPAWTTHWGPARGEVHMALLASYVVYYEGTIERVKRLDFHDGYELGWLPKGRFTFVRRVMGMKPYLESGAGLSYVSETYRNSGSRFNWSLLSGGGLETCLAGGAVFALGVQWRHLSNGNMWGKGDELHNSNSGTDMIQGMAFLVQQF